MFVRALSRCGSDHTGRGPFDAHRQPPFRYDDDTVQHRRAHAIPHGRVQRVVSPWQQQTSVAYSKLGLVLQCCCFALFPLVIPSERWHRQSIEIGTILLLFTFARWNTLAWMCMSVCVSAAGYSDARFVHILHIHNDNFARTRRINTIREKFACSATTSNRYSSAHSVGVNDYEVTFGRQKQMPR